MFLSADVRTTETVQANRPRAGHWNCNATAQQQREGERQGHTQGRETETETLTTSTGLFFGNFCCFNVRSATFVELSNIFRLCRRGNIRETFICALIQAREVLCENFLYTSGPRRGSRAKRGRTLSSCRNSSRLKNSTGGVSANRPEGLVECFPSFKSLVKGEKTNKTKQIRFCALCASVHCTRASKSIFRSMQNIVTV